MIVQKSSMIFRAGQFIDNLGYISQQRQFSHHKNGNITVFHDWFIYKVMGTFLLVGVNEHHFQKHNQEKSISQIPINTCQNGKRKVKN